MMIVNNYLVFAVLLFFFSSIVKEEFGSLLGTKMLGTKMLIRKVEKNNAKKVDINEIVLYLKSQYMTIKWSLFRTFQV